MKIAQFFKSQCKNYRQFVLLFVFSLFSICAQAQDNNELLANNLYNQKDYVKAGLLYEQLTETQPSNELYHYRYLQCLVQTANFDKASKYLKKKIKKSSQPLPYIIDDCYLAVRTSDNEKAQRILSLILDKIKTDYNAHIYAFQLFERYEMRKQCIAVLEQAQNEFGPLPEIVNQLAVLHLESGDRLKGIQIYVDMLTMGRVGFNNIKHLLEAHLADSTDIAAFQSILLKEIQVNPDNNQLTMALNYTFIKQENWSKAFIFAKALDKKLKEKGARVFELGELCISNKAYDVALQCFQYCTTVSNEDDENRIWHRDWIKQAEIAYIQYINKGNASDTKALIQLLSKVELQFGPSQETIENALNLAKLYVANDSAGTGFKRAESIIRRYLDDGFIRNRNTIARLKIALGDAIMSSGDLWTSELLYAQVEKDFKEEEIGQLAKFKRAELSFYRGDFEWASMQLNVLKGATTQLISNDAMELALIIIDNLGMDSNYQALSWYGKALLAQRQMQYKIANKYLDSIVTVYPGHALSDETLYIRAQMEIDQRNYAKAAEILETLTVAFGFDILADNAYFLLANLYQNRLNQPEKAMQAYQTILEKYSSSVYVVDARREFRKLRGDKVL